MALTRKCVELIIDELVVHAAASFDRGYFAASVERELTRLIREEEPMTMEAALLKLHLSETFVQSSLDAVRTFGGAGYLTEIEIERDLRDSVGGLLYAGTNDIQRLVVARMLGL